MDNAVNTALPAGLDQFLDGLGWGGGKVSLLAADASFRRYFRISDKDGRCAVIMDAPPPHEDPTPFIKVATYLRDHGLRAPDIMGHDLDRGLVLLEDFGDIRMRDHLDDHPDKETGIYQKAIDTLAELSVKSAANVPPYDMDAYLREVRLLTEWYVPAMGLSVPSEEFDKIWQDALSPLVKEEHLKTTVLRDYHAENIMLLADGSQGIIDFQDALVGHRAYDLVSLLQDARRDVSPELETAMFEYYCASVETGPDFGAHYALLGAQRNTKIIGIFTRLWKRDGKARYLDFLDRMWTYLERDLDHPQLAPLKSWFDTNIPKTIRRDMPIGAPAL
jgi:aminoglycoside/choline kinase family phosphotransferase